MKTKPININYIAILVILFILIIGIANAERINPAKKYCEELGYEYKYDSSTGLENCTLPDGSSVIAWKFLLGEVAQKYSYCKQNNLGIRIVTNAEICSELGLDTCAVCIFPDHKEVEVTKAMNLKLVTGFCGDNFCNIGETYETCKEDCSSGSIDGYCDSVNDGICDEDCIVQQIPASDIDCPYCGDGICKFEENYDNCKSDCPSGFKDNYCDAISDGRCDSDCINNQDTDCNKLSWWQKLINWVMTLFQ